MKLIIAGTRYFETWVPYGGYLEDAIAKSGWRDDITEVVDGGAWGVDSLGVLWAKKNGIPFITFWANWRELGKKAGPIRNAKMAKYADALLLLWDGKSPGSKNMLRCMEKAGKPVYSMIVDAAYKADKGVESRDAMKIRNLL